MSPILIGFGSALLFGIFACATYGLDGLTHYAWVGTVVSGLIIGALLVSSVTRKLP